MPLINRWWSGSVQGLPQSPSCEDLRAAHTIYFGRIEMKNKQKYLAVFAAAGIILNSDGVFQCTERQRNVGLRHTAAKSFHAA